MKESHIDRFIPSHVHRDNFSHFSYSSSKQSEASTHYTRIMSHQKTKYLKYSSKSVDSTPSESISHFILHSLKKLNQKSHPLEIVKKADRILDAPEVINDFYHNPLDWGGESSKIGVALGGQAYLLHQSMQIDAIHRYSSIPITSLKLYRQNWLLLGESTGRLQLHDLEKNCRMRQLNIHYNRIGVIEDIKQMAPIFITGSQDRMIKLNDIRLKKTDIQTFEKHSKEVCGLSVQSQYFASGGNDNMVVIWDLRKNIVDVLKHHRSAVKALSWCPWRNNVLVSGGGSRDKKIIVWNANCRKIQKQIQFTSQVSHIKWRPSSKTMISTHFNGKNGYIIIWDGNKRKIKLKGHAGRILGYAQNPINNYEACSLGGDETLRLWNTENQERKQKENEEKFEFHNSERNMKKRALLELDDCR